MIFLTYHIVHIVAVFQTCCKEELYVDGSGNSPMSDPESILPSFLNCWGGSVTASLKVKMHSLVTTGVKLARGAHYKVLPMSLVVLDYNSVGYHQQYNQIRSFTNYLFLYLLRMMPFS